MVAQLGLQQRASRQQLAQQAGLDEGAWLLGRVGEFAAAQEEAAAAWRQLAVAQTELERLRAAGAAQQQAHLQQAQHGLGGTVAYTFEGVRQVRRSNSAAAPQAPVTQHCWPPQQQQQPAHRASDQEQVSAVDQQLIDTLLQENQELRGRLAAAEVMRTGSAVACAAPSALPSCTVHQFQALAMVGLGGDAAPRV